MCLLVRDLIVLHKLEIYFQAKLEDSRVACGGDGTEAGSSHNRGWGSQRRSIGQIKDFSAKLDVAIFAEVGTLYQRDVGVSILWTTHRVARTVSERKLRCDRECRRVEESSGCPF